MKKFKIEFLNPSGPPRQKPNPRYPQGMDIDLSHGKPSCLAQLPYPAAERGDWYIECPQCGTNALITAAGRADDPKSVRLPCKLAVFRQ